MPRSQQKASRRPKPKRKAIPRNRGSGRPFAASVWQSVPSLFAWLCGSVLAALWLGLFLVVLGGGMMRLVAAGSAAPLVRPAMGGQIAGVSLPDPWLGVGSIPVAVVVENHVESRPTFGLERARIVYEAPVEGGITRYLAIFDRDDLPEVIGPVRSARPYLIEWASEWLAVLWHSGGSPAAYQLFQTGAGGHVDEISALGRYFWRDRNRYPPHNLFTSGSAIREAFTELRLPIAGVPPALAWDEEPAEHRREGPVHPAVRLSFRDPDYCVGYVYDLARDVYQRWLAGAPQVSATGEAISARTVIVPIVSARVIDREGRLNLATKNGGIAHLFIHGEYEMAEWRWHQGKTRFVDSDGAVIAFPPGPIWITVVTAPEAVTLLPADFSPPEAFRCAVD